MNNRCIYVPEGGPPTRRPPSEIFEKMGEANIFLMIKAFYYELEQSKIRSMFPADMAKASEKSAAFFVFLFGGPPLYHQKYGSPMMRQRHIPFIIDEEARSVWIGCFNKVLDEAPIKWDFPKEHLEETRAFIEQFSRWMVNTQITQ